MINATKEFIEPKFDEEKEGKSPNPIVNTTDIEDIQGKTEFIQHGINVDPEMERIFPNTTVYTVALIDLPPRPTLRRVHQGLSLLI